jgi:hypothetical protein
VDARGNVYIAESDNLRVREVNPRGGISTFARIPSVPVGVAVDAHGNVYVSDHLKMSVLKVSSGGKITTMGGNGREGFSGDSGPATSAELNHPDALAVDARGDVYIADTSDNRVREVTPAGTITTIAGTGRAGFSGKGGPATSAKLKQPEELAVDGKGDLFIADPFNNRVREVNPGGTIRTFAGTGQAGYSDFLPATSTRIKYPDKLATDAKGDVNVEDADDVVLKLGRAPTSGPLLWTALGGKVECGLAGFLPEQLLCGARPVPPPRAKGIGDSGFVFLRSGGRALLARLSQYSWVGVEPIESVALRSGSEWNIRATGIECCIDGVDRSFVWLVATGGRS